MFFNAKSSTRNLTLSLDIDAKTEVIKSLEYSGEDLEYYRDEMDELRFLVMGKSLLEIKSIKRSQIKKEKLVNGHRPVNSMALFLLREAIAQYLGENHSLSSQRDLVCLCFAVTNTDIKKRVLSDNRYELKTLITDTHATSACGSCKMQVLQLIDKTRLEHGLIKGLEHSRSRFDSEGKWLKIKDFYPGPLLLKIERLKIEWMEREGILSDFEIELVNLEGYHLEVCIKPKHSSQDNEKTFSALCLALSDFLKAELGVLFFIQNPPHHH